MKTLRTRSLVLALTALSAAASGCGALLGLGDFTEGSGRGGGGDGGGGGGGGGSGGATVSSASSSSSVGGATGTSVSGTGGTGGAGCVPVAETCASPVDEDCDGHDCVRWAELLGDAGDQTVGGVAVDAAGNVVVGGVFSGTLKLDATHSLTATGEDVYLLKLDPTGKVLWSKSFSAVTKPRVGGVAVDSAGNVAIAGTVDGSINFGAGAQSLNFTAEGEFMAELKPDGTLLWGILADRGDTDHVGDVGFDAADNLVVVGDSLDQMNMAVSLWLQKRSSTGAVVWAKSFDTMANVNVVAGGLAFDPTDFNRILLGGSFSGTVSFGGVTLTSAGGYDAFLLESDAAGAIKVRKQYGGAGDQGITGVAFDADSNRVVLGTFSGDVTFGAPASKLTSAGGKDIFVAKLTQGYAQVWVRGFGEASDQVSARVAVSPAGDVFFTGKSAGNVDYGGGVITAGGGLNLPLVKLQAADGAHLWSKVFGDAADQAGVSLAAMPDNGVVLGGNVAGSIDVGTGSKTAVGGVDILLARFAP
jgi:hypothetical protein